ncbi:MAG: SDR family oxidoreductase [Balneolaceae bacterium]|nr:SDR family oxidoreductase [Balneolaceae bacterium]
MKKLENKTALITGGNSGIGFTTAQTFIENGADVIITGRNSKKLEEAAKMLGDHAHFIKADSANLDDINHLAESVRHHFEAIDVLFLNAGVAKFAPITDISEELYDYNFDINVKGIFFTLQKLLPLINKNGSVIINGSVNAHMGMPGSSIYAASKAAVLSFARTISAEVNDRGIRVNAISPGPVATPIYSKMGASEEEMNEMAGAIQQQIPMGRFGNPDEIANAALFFASADSSFILGSELVVDGGMSQL